MMAPQSGVVGMKKTPGKELLIGAHTSAAGGVYNALLEGQRIGATTIQLFTSNQRQWAAKPLTEETIDLWKKTLDETGLKKIMSHDSYLINLGAPDKENLQKSRTAFHDETVRCLQLGITFLNFHPGAALSDDPQQCMDCICESLLEYEKLLEKGHTRLLLEATAGQGSSVGYRFEQLAYILQKVGKRVPLGVCIDTCHIFAAGYDIRTPKACDDTFKEFDAVVGLKHLYAFHLNDSAKALGSRVDRHQDLGKGLIGIECFKFLMQDPRTREIPKYLETPNGPEVWKKEIQMLREFADE
jgi:deoxyribonuclease-4